MNEGQKGKSYSDETRKKLSAALKGKPLSDETRRKMSEERKEKPSNRLGKPCSDDTKEKIRIGLQKARTTREKK